MAGPAPPADLNDLNNSVFTDSVIFMNILQM